MTQIAPQDSAFLYEVPTISELSTIFTQAKNWQEKYRQLMLLGKKAPKLDDEFKTDLAKIDGCESDAWLYHSHFGNKHCFIADSDARIVKGLIVILLAIFHSKPTRPEADVESVFTDFGLYHQLSPSRTNGLLAMAKAMQSYF